MKTNKLAQVIRKIVREEVQKEVRNVLVEQKNKNKVKGGKKITLSEALSQTEQESYETVKNFSSTDARAGFASLQDGFNTSQQSMGFEGHNGQVVPTEKVDASVTKAMTRDYSDLVKRFKK